MKKQCTKCKLSFELSGFTKAKSRKDGLSAWCKDCSRAACAERRKSLSAEQKSYESEYQKAYRAENIERLKEYRKAHYLENRELYLESARALSIENQDKRPQVLKKYREGNKDSIVRSRREYRERNIGNPLYIARRAASGMVHRVMRLTESDKNERTKEILGYTHSQLVEHLESRFADGMSWSNYGAWHIDHIIPVAELISIGVTYPKKINALVNLRPLWALDNMKKHSHFELCHSDIEFIRAG